ncbi:MAG: sugar phosphate nucleotidyltransferase, partial [Brevinematia bacterium]
MKVLLLGGGKGKSLWPISRDNLPKQFSKILFEKSLFQRTIEFLREVVNVNDIFVIAPEKFKFFVKNQSMEILKTSSVNHIVEKESRGTLKAVSLGISHLIQNDVSENEIVIILNSDQIWKTSVNNFSNAVSEVTSNIPFGKIACFISSKSRDLRDKVEFEDIKNSIFGQFIGFSQKSKFSNLGIYVSFLRCFRDLIQDVFSSALETIIENDSFDGITFEDTISRKPQNILTFNWDVEVIDIDSISDISKVIDVDRSGNFLSGD